MEIVKFFCRNIGRKGNFKVLWVHMATNSLKNTSLGSLEKDFTRKLGREKCSGAVNKDSLVLYVRYLFLFVPFVTIRHGFLLNPSTNDSTQLSVAFIVIGRVPVTVPVRIPKRNAIAERFSLLDALQFFFLCGLGSTATDISLVQRRPPFIQDGVIMEIIKLLGSVCTRNFDENLLSSRVFIQESSNIVNLHRLARYWYQQSLFNSISPFIFHIKLLNKCLSRQPSDSPFREPNPEK